MIGYEIAEEIREQKARYCRYLDTKQWDMLEELALSNARLTFLDVKGDVLRIGGTTFDFASPREFVHEMESLFANAQTSHAVTNGEFTLISANEVSVIWAMRDRLVFRPILGLFSISMQGYGHYHELWQRQDDVWRLKCLKLHRTLIEFSPVAGMFNEVTKFFRA
jgi:hypothetical protein